MASGTRGAKRHGMSPQDVDKFMAECSKLLVENEYSELRRSTPAPTSRDSRADVDDTLQKDTSEIDELRHMLHIQRLQMAELRQEMAHRSPVTSDMDKVF